VAVKLDHVAFGTRSRKAAIEAMEALGFAAPALGRCTWRIAGAEHAADSASVVFAGEYLDFIEIANERWAAYLATSPAFVRGFAPTALVFSGAPRTADLEPYPIVRRLEADPAAEVAYEFAPLGDGSLPLGWIADAGPHALRRPVWTSHPNTALGILAVHLHTTSPGDALRTFAAAPLACAAGAGADRVDVGTAQVRLVQNLGAVPAYIAAVVFRVASLATARRVVGERGVAFAERADGIEIDRAQGFGVAVAFAEA
jgi:hypothetical protein